MLGMGLQSLNIGRRAADTLSASSRNLKAARIQSLALEAKQGSPHVRLTYWRLLVRGAKLHRCLGAQPRRGAV